MQNRLLSALECLTVQTEEDCPEEARSRHLITALLDAHDLIEELKTGKAGPQLTHWASLQDGEFKATLACGCVLQRNHPDDPDLDAPTWMSCPTHTHAPELKAAAEELLKAWGEGILDLSPALEKTADVMATIDAGENA